jgi:hypothetical protein
MESDTNKNCTWCDKPLTGGEITRDEKRVAINLKPLTVCNSCDKELHNDFE